MGVAGECLRWEKAEGECSLHPGRQCSGGRVARVGWHSPECRRPHKSQGGKRGKHGDDDDDNSSSDSDGSAAANGGGAAAAGGGDGGESETNEEDKESGDDAAGGGRRLTKFGAVDKRKGRDRRRRYSVIFKITVTHMRDDLEASGTCAFPNDRTAEAYDIDKSLVSKWKKAAAAAPAPVDSRLAP